MIKVNGFDDMLFTYDGEKIKYWLNDEYDKFDYKISYEWKFAPGLGRGSIIEMKSEELGEDYHIYIYTDYSKYILKIILIDGENNWYKYEYKYIGKKLEYITNNDNELDFDFLVDIVIPKFIESGYTRRSIEDFKDFIDKKLNRD